MGLIACVDSVPAECWPAILERAGRAGFLIEEVCEDDAVRVCALSRGPIGLGMGYDPTRPPGEVYIWCPLRIYWRRPLATRRLVFDLMRIVKACREV
ncbi:MAG: hypothetical protein BGO49_25885 [Planctomycetales bacterium 71-10]|nr:MAG: hypothetical protein BGO49_25885 [Planctomycetales bacterium 71-10]